MTQTVRRAGHILRFVAEQPRTLGDVATKLGLHKSTALRLLQTLEEGGLVRRKDGRYTIGFGLIAIAWRALDQLDVRTVARPHLERLCARSGYTVHLAELNGREIVYLDKVEPAGSVRLHSRVGDGVTLHTAAVSKAILAFQDEAQQADILSRCDFARHSPTTITSPEQFQHVLSEVRTRGFAVDDGELEDYAACVAAPIRDSWNRVTAAVSMTALQAIADLDRLTELVPDVTETATAISAELGPNHG